MGQCHANRVRTTTERGKLHPGGRVPVRIAVGLGLALGTAACDRTEFVEIASGFDLMPTVRPALTEGGTVVAASPTELVVGDGTSSSVIDLGADGLAVVAGFDAVRAVAARSAGDVVVVADRPGATAACPSGARGAYRTTTAGGPVTTLVEGCRTSGVGIVGPHVAMSPNGTVAVSQLTSGQGSLHRGPAVGPLEILRSGTGTFYNTQALDVNDAGRVPVQMEYFDGFAGGLMRGILVFDEPEQDKADIDTAVEKLGIGQQPRLAINGAGTVVFALNSSFSITIGGTTVVFEPGLYQATPTLFNTPKSLTLLVGLGGDYCAIGNVDIADDGLVVFEAQRTGGPACGTNTTYDGLFRGASAADSRVVVRGDERLGGHQYFDSIRLGEVNASQQVSFVTTYSEPLVEPVKIWRADLNP